MPADFFAALADPGTPPVYHFFDGHIWKKSRSAKTVRMISPVNSQIWAEIQEVTPLEIDQAFAACRQHQPAWSQVPFHQKAKIMHLAADWIRHFSEYLTSLLVWEVGKTFIEAESEIMRTADLIDSFADEALSLRGETLDSDLFPGFDKGKIALIERIAQGTVLAISPFNYPFNLAASKIIPALLMGNAVVFKPSLHGTVIGLHLVQICRKAGIPEGVLTAITGSSNVIGEYLVSHPQVDMLTFTGSSETGEKIASLAPLKPILFECGGNNGAIVLPDAHLTEAAREIIKGAFSFSGQRCTAIKYVLATNGVLRQLIPILAQALKENVTAGDPRSPQTKLVGPLIDENAAKQVEQAIIEAKTQRAEILIGGKRDGLIIEPTILTRVKPGMGIVKTEVFGPVLSLIEIENFNQAVEIINQSTYGLQACIFTSDEGTGINLGKKLNVGTVQINSSPQRGPDHFPFLGVKKSGVGVQGVRYTLEAVSRLRPLILNKPT